MKTFPESSGTGRGRGSDELVILERKCRNWELREIRWMLKTKSREERAIGLVYRYDVCNNETLN
jgi:hypothetical protein